MTPPAPTPEEMARDLVRAWKKSIGHRWPSFSGTVLAEEYALEDMVAQALAAAHARGRAEGLEEAAKVADFSHQTTWPDDNDHWSGISPYRAAVSEAKSIAAAIRALGQ